MRLYASLFAFALLCLPVAAAEKIKIQLSPNDAASLMQALGALDGYTRVIHGARGEEEAKFVPYDLGEVRLTIAHDARIALDEVKDYQKAATGLTKEESEKLAKAAREVEMLSIDVVDLKIAVNPIPAGVLVALAPVCKGCAQ